MTAQWSIEDPKWTLEEIIDARGLSGVLGLLEEIAYEKAEHVEAIWQDRLLARHWRRVATTLGAVCKKVHAID
jgi:hypothetical protein